jgi:hypothetical protein
MNRVALAPAVLALLLSVAAPGAAQELGPGVAEVRDCMARNLPRSGRQPLRVERTDRSGNTRALEATAFWKRGADGQGRFLVRIEAPPDERGAAFLLLASENGNDLWAYLPDLRAVRRITGRAVSGSFFASDFTYEDIVQLQGEARAARIELLADAEIDGRPVRVLSGVPAPGSGSQLGRVVTFVDRETCVALRTELYGPGGSLVKEMRIAFADVERQGDGWRPRAVAMRHLEQGSESRLVFGAGEWNVELPDRLFSQNELAKGR